MNKDDKARLREEYKLIAEFLGWHYIPYDAERDSKLWAGWHKAVKVNTEDTLELGVVRGKNPGFITRKTLDLNFRYDWGKLMEVVLFIESLEDRKHGGFKVIIDSDCCTISSKFKSKETSYNTACCSKGDKKKAVYESILLFINFYKT